jgi:hypothetical protein
MYNRNTYSETKYFYIIIEANGLSESEEEKLSRFKRFFYSSVESAKYSIDTFIRLNKLQGKIKYAIHN